MKDAKIKLSEDELRMVQDAGIILTKNRIIQRVVDFFAALSENMQTELTKAKLPLEAGAFGYKISRGENYKGLPYVVLDCPRLFGRENIFAIRTMFWWGNYFSTTLHIKGEYKKIFGPAVRSRISQLGRNHFSLCISPDEWKHELNTDNYGLIADLRQGVIDDIFENSSFLKISKKTALTDWENAPEMLMKSFREILEAINSD